MPLPQLTDEGAYADLRATHDVYDLHFHTRHSDGLARVGEAVARARELGIKVAITDHNVIGGVLEANDDETIVPGIEITTAERIHLLVYFRRRRDLVRFWDRSVAPFRPPGASPLAVVRRSVVDLLTDLQAYDHPTSAAHPFAFAKNGWMTVRQAHAHIGTLIGDLCAVETTNGEELDSGNELARALARDRSFASTAGSDGHLLRELGTVALALPKGTDLFEGVRGRAGTVVDLRPDGLWRRAASQLPKARYYAAAPARVLRNLI